MKNTDIQKIRQLLKDIVDAVNCSESNPTKRHCLRNVKQALALFPCETCGGVGYKPRPKGTSSCRFLFCQDLTRSCGECNFYISRELCPDCQSK